MIKKLLERWLKLDVRRSTVRCKRCDEKFNAKTQAGICPHIPIEQFIYAKDVRSSLEIITDDIRKDKMDCWDPQVTAFIDAVNEARNRWYKMKDNPPPFIARGWDPGAPNGDYGIEIEGYVDKDGKTFIKKVIKLENKNKKDER